MSDFAVGKNGMPGSPPSAVRILRPGDPGFPADAGQYQQPEQPTRTEPMSDKTLCMFQGCKNPKPPGMGRRYCAEHADPETRQKAAHRPAGKRKPKTKIAKTLADVHLPRTPADPGRLVIPPGGDLRAIAASYRQAADLLDQAADLLAPAASSA